MPPFPVDSALDGDASADQDGSTDEHVHSRPARNIIVFMGDGMGADALATGRYAAGGRLRLDVLAGPALSTTDSQTTLRADPNNAPATDSAASATAIAAGVLVENGVLSQTSEGAPLETVLEVYKRAGKATGIVTTSMFYDASPAAFVSHQASRWNSAAIVRETLAVTEVDVVMGAGVGVFDNPAEGLHEVADAGGYAVVRNVTELSAWDPTRDPRLLGVFENPFRPNPGGEAYLMTPALERTASSSDPTLATMTERAIDRLSRDADGFFLFAEDEAFDILGHRGTGDLEWANRAYPAQAMAFDAAVGVAIDWVLAHSSFDETLIVVLSDHETGGYRFDHMVGPSSGSFANSGLHTRTPIEVYALGPGSQSVLYVKTHLDTHRLLLGTLP